MSFWKKLRLLLEYRLVSWLARVIPRLSRRSCVHLGYALGSLLYLLDGRGRGVALANLKCAYGQRLTTRQRRAIARASCQNFLRTMLDLFWAKNLTRENWREWIKPVGFEELRERLQREERGTIFMCIHQGNWEWASLASGFLEFGNVVVAEQFKNPLLAEIFTALRQRSGQTIIPQENSLLRMLKVVKRRGATGMLIDLSLRPTQAATVVEGFGMKMCVPLLHAVLAQRANALLVPVETLPQHDGTCRVIAHPGVEFPPGASLREISQLCWDAFKPSLRARPDLWLWPYKHFRYRPRNSMREYPYYANESSKFEKLMRESGL